MGTIQIFHAIFVDINDFERKISEEYVKDHFAQQYFGELCDKRKVKDIIFLDVLLKWK